MLTLHSFLQSVCLFVKSLAIKVRKQMYRSSFILVTGMTVVAIIVSSGGFGGGGTRRHGCSHGRGKSCGVCTDLD